MSFWRVARCPVDPPVQAWVDERMLWLESQFGREPLHRAVATNVGEFVPADYLPTDENIGQVVHRLCERMSVSEDRIHIEVSRSDDEPIPDLEEGVLYADHPGEAAHYQTCDGRALVTVAETQAEDPLALVAWVSHILADVILVGGNLASAKQRDVELLADLVTIYFGVGVFTANVSTGAFSRRTHTQLGYLGERACGYALARYALMRGEPEPEWAKSLDPNPLSFLRQSLAYLKSKARNVHRPRSSR